MLETEGCYKAETWIIIYINQTSIYAQGKLIRRPQDKKYLLEVAK